MPARTLRRTLFSLAAGRLQSAFCALILLLSAFCLLPAAFADIQAPPRATAPGERRLVRRGDGPPTAIPQETVVPQGGQVEIILRAEGQVGRMIYFLIRTPPKHGTIVGPPTQVSRSSATIGYLHSEGDDATDDEFTFCAQAVGSAVSAPETVKIRIMPSPPLLEVSPAELDFGAVKAGEIARAEFTLENHGGSEAQGRVVPPSPWVVEGSPDYRVPRGGSQTFKLTFRPQDERAFTDELHFQYEARNSGVRLVGTGLMDPAQKAAALAAATAAARANAARLASANHSPGASGGATTTNGAAAPANSAGSQAPNVAPAGGGASSGRPADTAATTPREPGGGISSSAGGDNGLANPDLTSVIVNEASVERVEVRAVKGNTVDLAWRPPVPKPASYRVEVRSLSIDDDDKLRIDWRPYAKIDLSAARDEVTAHLRGLPQEGFQMLRVVAVDRAGRLASPSPMITVLMPWPTSWWHVTPLKVLLALLAICVFFVVRRRLENEAILREIDEDRAEAKRAAEKEAEFVWKT